MSRKSQPSITTARSGIPSLILFGTIALFILLSLWAFISFRYQLGYWLYLLFSGHYNDVLINPVLPAKLQNFITLALSLIVEGLPFVILGVLFATIIRMFVSASVLLRFLPRQRYLRRLLIALFGVFMPVCECGNVPVARGLMNQGMSTQDVTVFLLAAPIINPITLFATWQAFGFNHSVAILRLFAALGIALLVAAILDRMKRSDQLLTASFAKSCELHQTSARSWDEFLENYQTEFWLILKMLCIGATIAAVTQTLIPREVLTALGSNIWLSLLSMLALSIIVSICSGVDAFFALSYANAFPIGPIVTYLIAGPMINIKSLSLMKSTFTLRYLVVVVPVVAVTAVSVGFALNAWGGGQ